MDFELKDAMTILRRTPTVLRAMLDGMDDRWVRANYGEETFSPFDVVGHLIHGERTDWVPRVKIILENGPNKPFEPFDRYAMYEADRGKSMGELLDTFARLRAENLRTIEGMTLTAADFARTGMHPALGVVTLGHLLATWPAHDLNHVAQIAKALAHQYEEAVGPWRAYMSILRPAPAG